MPGAVAKEETVSPGAELDAKIKSQGDTVRKLKTEKADKTAIETAVKSLLELKAEFKAATGNDWKPAAAPGGGDKKGKENKSPPPTAAGGAEEKSDNQKKKDAKKAEKAAKKAAHKAESGKETGAEDKDDGPDVSTGKYGVQEMNQSRYKPDTIITHIGELGVKLDDKTVTIRGRLHTSRAKGKQCFMVIRQQQVTVQCLVFVSEKVSKQMVKFASHVSKESIVDVEAVVKKVGEKIESCTQQDVELHVTQVSHVSRVTSAFTKTLPTVISGLGCVQQRHPAASADRGRWAEADRGRGGELRPGEPGHEAGQPGAGPPHPHQPGHLQAGGRGGDAVQGLPHQAGVLRDPHPQDHLRRQRGRSERVQSVVLQRVCVPGPVSAALQADGHRCGL